MKRRATGTSFDTGRAERLLADWANLPRGVDWEALLAAVGRLRVRYPDVCQDKHGAALALREWNATGEGDLFWLIGVRNHLEAIWTAAATARTTDEAEQYIFRLRELYGRAVWQSTDEKRHAAWRAAARRGFRFGDQTIQLSEKEIDAIEENPNPFAAMHERWPFPPIPDTFFDRTMRHLKRELRRASICRNPDCPAPYFFREVRGQKYCEPTGKCFHDARLQQQNARREAQRGRTAMRPGRPCKLREN